MNKTYTITAIKADVGSIGGHTRPSLEMLAKVEGKLEAAVANGVIIDYRLTHTGDDICMLMTHKHGKNEPQVHDLAMRCFFTAADIAKQQGCYGAGQDIKVTAATGNVKGAGPGVAELTVTQTKDRPSEQILVAAADKTSPGAYNLPLFNLFLPTFNDAALLAKPMFQGATIEVMDMDYKGKSDHRCGEFHMPEDMYRIAVLLKNPNRYAISSIRSRQAVECGDEWVSASTDRLHNLTGKYEGKDDPVLLLRAQKQFPAVEEIIQQFTKAHFVPGCARGSHTGPLMPVKMNHYHKGAYQSSPSMEPFCCPIVSCVGYSIVDGKITGPVDHFDSFIFDQARVKAYQKFEMMRENGFVEPAMLPDGEVEYVDGYGSALKDAETRFVSKPDERNLHPPAKE